MSKSRPYIIDDDTPIDEYMRPTVDGRRMMRGAVPRDYSVQPLQTFAHPRDIKLIPRSEWSDRIKDQEKYESSLEHIMDRGNRGGRIPTKNQNGHGYCWFYSIVACIEGLRSVGNMPYVDLSAHAGAAMVKKGRDEGGWCGLSAQFVRERGVPSARFWETHSRDYRRLWTSACELNARMHIVTEEWVDLDKAVYDQNLTFDMLGTLLLSNTPCALDFAWWGHSVMGMRLVEVERNSFGFKIRNSWTDGWGDRGTGIIRGSKVQTMGAVALRVTGASAT